jgi:hypothetical protein
VRAHQLHGAAAAWQADVVHHVGDRTDGGEVAVVTRHQEHPLLVAHVDRERGAHVREDDQVVEWDQHQIGHKFTFRTYLRRVSKYIDCTATIGARPPPRGLAQMREASRRSGG